MADGVWKVIGHFEPLSLNKFFDPSAPSMRKVRDRKKRKENGKWKIMMKIVATNVVASCSPERRPTATPTARAKIVATTSLPVGRRTATLPLVPK